MTARVCDHVDRTILSNIIIRTEYCAAAVTANRNDAFLSDTVS